ncbi:hypothetical protein Kisp01_46630 [Kineosporia sp. NBRC 101677]|uniref:hypothetical protein n=1 Tax=Kineosporia sp. NBRC 101677 TaxID=3032197 RepID=UPI0024A01EB9|nr:hypothetical protein [Kineosporia sp. NBRC 101677]GLY17649.1 hypothetical protein Kisp01_46630 [Kineosporia sp. NBRC 101677]
MIVWVLVGFALGFVALWARRTLRTHRERLMAGRLENRALRGGDGTVGPSGPSRSSTSF